jgi:hypothetical protein
MALSLRSSALVLSATLMLAACGSESEQSAQATPDGAVMQWVAALRKDDLGALMKSATTDEEFTKMRADWSAQVSEPPSDEQRAQFAMTMSMLTGPDAEGTLMLKVEPELAKMKPQVDMLLGMLEGMATAAMSQSETLTPQQQEQGRAAVQAMVETLRKNDITDPGRARKAVGIVCKTARQLELKTIEDVQKLSFERALERGGVVLAGTKDLLEVYGFSVDGVLSSIKARTVAQNGDKATVEVSYTLLGIERTQQTEMERVGGRWVVQRESQEPVELESSIGG